MSVRLWDKKYQYLKIKILSIIISILILNKYNGQVSDLNTLQSGMILYESVFTFKTNRKSSLTFSFAVHVYLGKLLEILHKLMHTSAYISNYGFSFSFRSLQWFSLRKNNKREGKDQKTGTTKTRQKMTESLTMPLVWRAVLIITFSWIVHIDNSAMVWCRETGYTR